MMYLKEKVIDLDDFKEEYFRKIEELRINILHDLFSSLNDEFSEMIVDETIIRNMAEQGDCSDECFFTEINDALARFIIVERDTEEKNDCIKKVRNGDLMLCCDDDRLNNEILFYEI